MSSSSHTHSDNACFFCPLCCEDKAMDQLCVLTNCSHEQCKQCLSKWIQKAEAGGHKSKPECAFCRIEMTERDAQSILGRPFQPAKATSSPEDTEMDDLTQQWIQEHTQACPHCGSHIEKSGSCDKMECLCGYRFCFRCGSQGAQCNCSPPGHGFLAGLGALPPLAVVNEDTGRVDLGNHIIRRRELEEKKRYREFKDYRLSMEQESLDEFTSSALWLFCPNGTKRLNQHLQTERMKEERFFERVEKELQVERRDEQDVSSYGAWLFCEEKAAQRVPEQQGLLHEREQDCALEAWIANYGALSSLERGSDEESSEGSSFSATTTSEAIEEDWSCFDTEEWGESSVDIGRCGSGMMMVQPTQE